MSSSEQRSSNRNGWNEWSRYVLDLLAKHAGHIDRLVREVISLSREIDSQAKDLEELKADVKALQERQGILSSDGAVQAERIRAVDANTEALNNIRKSLETVQQKISAIESRLNIIWYLLGAILMGLIAIAFDVIGVIP